MSDETKGENEALIDVLEQYMQVQVIEPLEEKRPIVAMPSGMKMGTLKSMLDEYLKYPERRKGTSEQITDASFSAFVNRFKTDRSAIFATYGHGAADLTAVFDYHWPTDVDDERSADWCEHRAHYKFPFSDEWKTWTGDLGSMNQEAFAEFIEEHIVDICDPVTAGDTVKEYAKQIEVKLATPAGLMALSRGLSIRVEQDVVQSVNLSSGEGQITFSEEHNDDAGVKMSVPGAFALAIPVFQGGPCYYLPVRLRYRVKTKKISWTIKVARTDVMFDDAFTEVCDRVKKETGLPLFFGSPER